MPSVVSPSLHTTHCLRRFNCVDSIYTVVKCLICVILGFTESKLIQTYFLNKEYDFITPICTNCPQIECLLTEGSYKIPDDISICVRYAACTLSCVDYVLKYIFRVYRWKPLSFIHHNIKSSSFWALVLGIGNTGPNDDIMDNGIMFGVYESGPWLAFKFSNDPFPGWIGGGTELFNMMVKNTRPDKTHINVDHGLVCV